MSFKKSLLAVPVLLLLSINIGCSDSSQKEPIVEEMGAELTSIEGKVLVTTKSDNKTVQATEGHNVWQGDKIETEANSSVEIIYDNGNVTGIDENTVVTIRELSAEADRSSTVLDLSIGRLKNTVSKIKGKQTKFEVHTKSAVAGVTGTPPWVVTATPMPDGTVKTEVDLLTDDKEKGGAIFVTRKENKKAKIKAKKIILKPGSRTVVRKENRNLDISKIEEKRMVKLKTSLVVKIKEDKRIEKRKKFLRRQEDIRKKQSARRSRAKQLKLDREQTKKDNEAEEERLRLKREADEVNRLAGYERRNGEKMEALAKADAEKRKASLERERIEKERAQVERVIALKEKRLGKKLDRADREKMRAKLKSGGRQRLLAILQSEEGINKARTVWADEFKRADKIDKEARSKSGFKMRKGFREAGQIRKNASAELDEKMNDIETKLNHTLKKIQKAEQDMLRNQSKKRAERLSRESDLEDKKAGK